MSSPGPDPCHCCGEQTVHFGRQNVLGKYPVNYYRCPACGFIQTESPHWLAESYANPMTAYDLGGVSRPKFNSTVIKPILNTCFDPAARFLDFGGGYGVFTRWMRDEGFDFWHHDKHCQNLFANGFEADISGKIHYELATAFEVFEHVPDPADMLESLFRVTESIFFTTDLLPEHVLRLEDWWYFGPEHGQHVAFYTPAALRALGARFGAKYLAGPENFHLLTRRDIPPARFQIALGTRARSILNFFIRRPPLLRRDFDAAIARAREAAKAAP